MKDTGEPIVAYFGVLVRYTAKHKRKRRLLGGDIWLDLDMAEELAVSLRKNTKSYESATVVRVQLSDLDD